jgi:hypothetical protein
VLFALMVLLGLAFIEQLHEVGEEVNDEDDEDEIESEQGDFLLSALTRFDGVAMLDVETDASIEIPYGLYI